MNTVTPTHPFGMLVCPIGLNDNPETLVARCAHENGWTPRLKEMYDLVFNRWGFDEDNYSVRIPYTFEEVCADLEAEGYVLLADLPSGHMLNVWQSADVANLLETGCPKIKLGFQSLVADQAYARVTVSSETAVEFTADMVSSGLWSLADLETVW